MMQIPIIITASGKLPSDKDIYLIDPSKNDIIVTLPDITADGIYYRLCRIDNELSNNVIVNASNPSETINGKTSISITDNTGIEVISINNVWYSI